jgi:pyrroline-5-carboxylate reductase
MGGAILAGLLRESPGRAERTLVFDPSAGQAPAPRAASAVEAVERSEVIVVAVKPQVIADALGSVADVAAGRLFVSVVAGVTTSRLETMLPGGRVVRTMPNTPLLAGKGAVALCPGDSARPADLLQARALFPGSLLVEIEEQQMDAVTALSGSGPAYFYAFVEALADAGLNAGLPRETAKTLAEQTFIGAAALLNQSGQTPAVLRERVTSPGGTTAAGLNALAQGGLAPLVHDAVAAARRRAARLAAPTDAREAGR